MDVKGTICQSGGKKASDGRYINEDGLTTFDIYHNDIKYKFIILMDGATGLGKSHEITPGLTSAEWYVDFMMAEMKKVLSKDPTIPLEDAVEQCILGATKEISSYEIQNNVTMEEYEKPSAGLALLRTDGKTTDIYLIGDTETIIGYKTGEVKKVDNPNQKALQKLDGGVLSRMAELAKERNCNVLDTRTDPEIETMLQINRSKKNAFVEGAYWVCGTTPGTAKHGTTVTFDNSQIDGILLASDGFDYSMLDFDEKTVYEAVKKYGSDFVARAIRNVQAEDSKCNRFPRFKQGDDLSIVHFDYKEREVSLEDRDSSR